MVSTFFFAILASCFASVLVKKLKGQRPLPPGPWGLPILGSLPFLDPQLHTYFANLAQKYGPIFTLMLGGKTSIVISSPTIASQVLKDHDVTFANRDPPTVTRALDYNGHDIVFVPYGPEWRMLRKVCVRDMLCSATLDEFYTYRRREIRNTIKFLYDQKRVPVKVGEKMFLNVLDVITSMLWGGTIEGKERAIIGAEFKQAVSEMTQLLGNPNVSDFFPWLAWLDLQGMRKEMKVVAAKFDRIFDRIIEQRTQIDAAEVSAAGDGSKKSRDFLQVLLQLKGAADAKTPLTMKHIRALLLDMVVGGTETTSNTVEFALAEMLNKPETLKKAQQELDNIVGKANIVEESHIRQLPYLQAIMKEVLRLHPALPLMVPHCPSQTCVVGNYTVPKGSRVFVNVWAIHRDPSVWENPSEFIPERFLNGKGDYSGNDFKYIPFGSGRRMCAGISMAERMVMYSLASLVHSFDWELPVGVKVDLSEKFGIVMQKSVPLLAIPTPRLSDPSCYE